MVEREGSLSVSDLHLTDKNADEYRWDLFPKVLVLIRLHRPKRVIVAGDILDAKDGHSGRLLNRVVDGLVTWAKEVDELILLHGNHDSLENSNPYLYFLRHVPNIRYINHPLVEGDEVFLPHSREPLVDWANIDVTGKTVWAHVTVNGALAESMIPLQAQIEPSFFDKAKFCFSGDIHKPQQIGPVVYIGSPYQVRFGDNYQGGGILLKSDKWERFSLSFPEKLTFTIRTIEDMKAWLEQCPNTGIEHQLKIKLQIDQGNIADWKATVAEAKNLAAQRGLVVQKIDFLKAFNAVQPTVTSSAKQFLDFDQFCLTQGMNDDLKDFGLSIIREVDGSGTQGR